MAVTIQIKRGTDAQIQAGVLSVGELAFATDTKHVYTYDGVAKQMVGRSLVDTLSNRPAFGVSGRLYFASDTSVLYVDTGSAWVAVSGSSAASPTITGTAGESLSRYDCVYMSSGKFYKAQNDGTEAEADAVGIVTQSGGISTDGTGEITLQGLVTNSGWAWTAGSQLYLSSTLGGLTDTQPNTYVKPIGFAVTTTQIFVNIQTGWLFSESGIETDGFFSIPFSEASTSLPITTVPADSIITQITAVVSTAAGSAGASIQIGTEADTDVVMATSVVDLTQQGNHIVEPFYVSPTTSEYLLTVSAAGKTFSGTLYFQYITPNRYTGMGRLASASFSNTTSSPLLLATLPTGSVVTKAVVVVSGEAAGGSPTVSIGTSGDSDLLFDETDCDLLTLGNYVYEPFVSQSGAIYLTITPSSQTFNGRAYVYYAIP